MSNPKAGIIATLALFFSAVAVAGPKKPEKLPMPPLVSHGEKITSYGCSMTEISATSVQYAWSLDVWAEYGPKHRRRWKKSLGIYEGSSSEDTVTSHGAESAATGAPIGPITTFTTVGPAQQECQQWKKEVMQETATPVKAGTPPGAKPNRP